MLDFDYILRGDVYELIYTYFMTVYYYFFISTTAIIYDLADFSFFYSATVLDS